MSVDHLYIFLGKMSIEVFGPFFNLIVCFLNFELYKFFVYFGYLPPSDILLADIFSHSVGEISVLWIVPFIMQKCISLIYWETGLSDYSEGLL